MRYGRRHVGAVLPSRTSSSVRETKIQMSRREFQNEHEEERVGGGGGGGSIIMTWSGASLAREGGREGVPRRLATIDHQRRRRRRHEQLLRPKD